MEYPGVGVIAPRRPGNPTSMSGDYLMSKIDRMCWKLREESSSRGPLRDCNNPDNLPAPSPFNEKFIMAPSRTRLRCILHSDAAIFLLQITRSTRPGFCAARQRKSEERETRKRETS